MNLRTIHARELAAPAADAGALLDLLGGPEDRLWPNDTWPASALRLEHPLRVGSRGGHGAIRYRVADYEPGRRIVFAFEPESGVSGRHETRVDALGPARCRLVQTTECRLAAKLLPLYPVLRRQHDALLRDVLDRAELELTGAVAAPARWSRTVRAANVVEEALARRRGTLPRITPSRPLPRAARVAGVGAPAAIGGVAVVHAAWAAGWHWPGGSEEALAQRVLSSGSTEMPPDWLTWLVAGVFAGSAAAVSATAVGAGGRRARRATWATAGVFAVRGVLGPIQDAFTGLGTYERLDLAIYSPLCLAIAAGAAAVAWRAGGRTTPTGTPRGNREPAPRRPTANAVSVSSP